MSLFGNNTNMLEQLRTVAPDLEFKETVRNWTTWAVEFVRTCEMTTVRNWTTWAVEQTTEFVHTCEKTTVELDVIHLSLIVVCFLGMCLFLYNASVLCIEQKKLIDLLTEKNDLLKQVNSKLCQKHLDVLNKQADLINLQEQELNKYIKRDNITLDFQNEIATLVKHCNYVVDAGKKWQNENSANMVDLQESLESHKQLEDIEKVLDDNDCNHYDNLAYTGDKWTVERLHA